MQLAADVFDIRRVLWVCNPTGKQDQGFPFAFGEMLQKSGKPFDPSGIEAPAVQDTIIAAQYIGGNRADCIEICVQRFCQPARILFGCAVLRTIDNDRFHKFPLRNAEHV